MRSYKNPFNKIILYRDAKMSSRNCVVCNIDVHRASYVKQLRSKKYLENIKQKSIIIPEGLIKEHVDNKNKNL